LGFQHSGIERIVSGSRIRQTVGDFCNLLHGLRVKHVNFRAVLFEFIKVLGIGAFKICQIVDNTYLFARRFNDGFQIISRLALTPLTYPG
jgi:hypothetical protein